MDAIPARGPLAAITVAGAVSGWEAAADLARLSGGRLPLSRLFEDAIYHARHGFPVSRSQHDTTAAKRGELEDVPGFATVYLPGGGVPAIGALFGQSPIAATLVRIAHAGLAHFYRAEFAPTTHSTDQHG